MTQRPRPAFEAVELDPIDARLEAKAAEKGIPKLVQSRPEPAGTGEGLAVEQQGLGDVGAASEAQPRGEVAVVRQQSMAINAEVPEYVWMQLKIACVKKKMTMRQFTLLAYKAQGIEVKEEDLCEDGRRLRGSRALQKKE